MMQRLFVSMNMAESLDGKIASFERGPAKLGTAYDSKRMLEIRAEQDVVVMGARTFEAYPKPLLVKSAALRRARQKRRQTAEPATAIVSSRLDFKANTPWEMAKGVLRLVFCGRHASRKAILRLRKNGVYVVVCRGERPSADEILQEFAKIGFRRILLEGGGEFNAIFFKQDLVDRLYITLCPLLIGGATAPSFFEGQGLKKTQFLRWRLKEYRPKKNELYLIYERT